MLLDKAQPMPKNAQTPEIGCKYYNRLSLPKSSRLDFSPSNCHHLYTRALINAPHRRKRAISRTLNPLNKQECLFSSDPLKLSKVLEELWPKAGPDHREEVVRRCGTRWQLFRE